MVRPHYTVAQNLARNSGKNGDDPGRTSGLATHKLDSDLDLTENDGRIE